MVDLNVKKQNEDIVCDVKDISLQYQTASNQPGTIRDLFVSLLRGKVSQLAFTKPVTIFSGLNFQVSRGERIALIGLNGAGKTSLCRILSGVLRPTTGSISRCEGTRAVFQAPLILFPDLSGHENAELLIGLMYPHLSDRDVKELTKATTLFAELGPALFSPVRTYSTGMQTRLMLSVVTAQPADFLILDEVFEGADIFWQKKIGARTRALIDQAGAFLFVSHNHDLLRDLCRQSLVLKGGSVYRFDTVEAGLDFYSS